MEGQRVHRMIGAIVLAAGASTRMGSPKPLLLFNGETFIRHIANMLTACGTSPIILVLGAFAAQVRKEVEGMNIHVTTNCRYEAGQLSSLQHGLGILRNSSVDGVLVFPVDHPAVRKETVGAILHAFVETKAAVVIPAYRGRRGHPVLFSSSVFDELTDAPAEQGARAVVWRHACEVVEVPTDDSAILRNVDTPEEYVTLLAESVAG